MRELFLKLLDMSLSASWLVLAVIGLRLVLKNAPKSIRCVLWGLVALRLLCPVSIESALSLVPEASPVESAIRTETRTLPTQTAVPETESAVYTSTTPAAQPQSLPEQKVSVSAPAPDTKAAASVGWVDIACILWAMGMAAMLLYALWSYRRIHKKVAASIDIGNGVRICDYIDSPFILGILRPKIYLPSALNPESAAYVLAHERSHLKRRDHWWKPLGFVLLSVYWFNPLLWAAYILLCRDIELACDERVIKEMGLRDKKAYSEALLSCSVPRRMIAACPLAFGEVGVKERVRSVLHYKKPAFWIVVIAVVLCIVVAVCFLTDPKTATLANFAGMKPGDADWIDFLSARGEVSLQYEEELANIWEVLESVEYDPDPISHERREATVDEYDWHYPCITLNHSGSTYCLYFTYDYTQVWSNDGGTISKIYAVTNPEVLQQFVAAYVDPVADHTASGEPFATADQPWQWMQGIGTECVQILRMYYDQTGDDYKQGLLSSAYFDQLLDILHSIPEAAVSEGPVNTASFDDLRYGVAMAEPQMTLTIADAANGLTAVLRIRDGLPELLLLDSTDWGTDVTLEADTISWQIDSPELLAFLQKLAECPPAVQAWMGSRYSLERIPVTVSHGSAAIQTVCLTDWDYEVAEYTEEAKSFGIRCRPKAVDEGWLYFSFWPYGYDPVEEDRYYQTYTADGYGCVTSWPSSVKHTGVPLLTSGAIYFYRKTEYAIGDYAIITEGADSWFLEYQDTIAAVSTFTSFLYGSIGTSGNIRSYGDVTVDFTGTDIMNQAETTYLSSFLTYFDWESIAAEAKVKELILFDPQEVDDLLFVGCQSGTDFGVVVFRQSEDERYEFADLLWGREIQQVAVDEQTILLYAHYETEDTEVYLYFVCSDAVRTLTFYGEYSDYILLDHCPALLVLDVTGREGTGRPSCSVSYDEPIPLAHRLFHNNSSLTFGTEKGNASLWYTNYIQNVRCQFYDGTDFPGSFSLTREEILQLRDILVNIPEEDIQVGYEEKELRTKLFISLNDAVPGKDGQNWYMELTYENGSTNLVMYQSPDYGYSFTPTNNFILRNDALNAFLEGLCDSGRTESSVAYNTPDASWTGSYVVYEKDYASIRLPERTDWVYEIVEYTDDNTPFGIRCRPEWADSGWLYFSYWPGGFAPDDEGRYLQESSIEDADLYGLLTWVQSYSQEPVWESGQVLDPVDWTYVHYTNTPGDYVVLNEGAESWMSRSSACWYIRTLLWYPELGECAARQEDIIQVLRELCDSGVVQTGWIDSTASNVTLNFDFHTGVWTAKIPLKTDETRFIELYLDKDGNLLQTLPETNGSTATAAFAGLPDQVQEGSVCIYDGHSRPGCFDLREDEVQELTEILASLPDSACSAGYEETDYQVMVNLVLADENQLLQLRYHDNVADLCRVDTQSGEWVTQEGSTMRIRSSTLNAFLEPLCDATRRESYVQMDSVDAPLEVSHGDGSIRVQPLVNWEYEIVEYTDDATPFGIRCRPEYAESGWLFISYWPDGYTDETEGYFEEYSNSQYRYIFCQESSRQTLPFYYIQFPDAPGDGDYIILNEGADDWFEEHFGNFFHMIEKDSLGYQLYHAGD